jgi:hypothetical protein
MDLGPHFIGMVLIEVNLSFIEVIICISLNLLHFDIAKHIWDAIFDIRSMSYISR